MSEPSPQKYQIFISHSSRDKEWADAVCAVLEKNRLRCWIAPRDIAPGTEWGAAIIGGIDACKVMVLVFSAHANESAQVRREVERAINKGLSILPFRVEDVPPEGAMELALSNTHWLDAFTPPPEPQLEALAESVKALLAKGGAATSTAKGQRPTHRSALGGKPYWLVGAAFAAILGAVALGAVALALWLYIRGLANNEPDGPPAPKPELVTIQLVGIAKPIDPKKIVFLLDNEPITYEALRKERTLAVGPHELVVQHDGADSERRDFVILKEHHQQKLVVPETALKPGKLTQLSGHAGEVAAVAFSGDGLRLLSVGPIGVDGAFVWDVPAGKQVHHYPRGKKPPLIKSPPWSGALSFDGHAALIGLNHAFKGVAFKPWVHAIGLESGTKLWESSEHTRRVNSVAFSRDGKLALSADDAGFTKVWDAARGNKLFQLEGSVACFSPTADRVLTAVKTEARLWQLSDPPRELKVFKGHSDLIRSMVFAPDGLHVLTGGDATLRWWDISTGKEMRIFKGHDKEVTSVAIAPDGKYVLSGSKDMTVRLWSVADGKEVLRFTDHTDIVTSVAYSPGGRRAASGSVDRTVRLWALPK